MTIKELCKKSHETAKSHGFWEGYPLSGNRPLTRYEQLLVGEKLFLAESELKEAHEEIRDYPLFSLDHVRHSLDGKPEGFLVEIADTFIRLADTIEAPGLTDQFVEVIRAKMRYNETRPHKHGKAF